ncbi:MAG: peptidylprolyl isomerase [Streptococcaceae bacterium]|jgi:foldase protein PrsA|nr:peptidylprolyl isomerase [Streptococcaceae bacterium]
MKIRNKLILGAASALALFSLAACGNSSADIATWAGGGITVQDFYNHSKSSSTSQSLVQQMIIYGVFEQKFGDKVSDADVTKQFDEIKAQQGDNWQSALQQAGYTEESLKTQIRQNLAFEAGLKSKVNITDADLKTAWEAFHPEVEASIIMVSKEEDAKAILADAKKDGADFAAIAKEKSEDTATKDEGGKVTFDSTSTAIPKEVMDAAFKLKDGEISDVIAVTNQTTFTQQFYIVKMNKTSEKGNDMTKFEKQVREIATQTQLADQTFQTRVIGEVLKDANVKISDDAFKSVLANFMTTGTSGTSGTSTSGSN